MIKNGNIRSPPKTGNVKEYYFVILEFWRILCCVYGNKRGALLANVREVFWDNVYLSYRIRL